MITIVRIFWKSISSALRKPNLRLSVMLVLGVILLSTVLLSINVIGKTYHYSIGDIARGDIRVPVDIVYTIDSETDMERRRVAESVPLVFDEDRSVLMDRLKMVETLFEESSAVLKEIPPTGTEDRTFQFITLKSRLPKYLKLDDRTLYNLLRNQNPAEIKQTIKRILIYVLDTGFLEKPYENPLNLDNRNVAIRTVNSQEEGNEVSVLLENLRTMDTVMRDLYNLSRSIAPNLAKEDLLLVHEITKGMLRPNLSFNAEETKRRMGEAMKSVKPVTAVLKKGQTIVREGDTITTEILGRISILNRYTTTTRFNYIIGVLILQLSFLLIFGYFLLEYQSRLLPDFKTPLVIFSVVAVFLLYTFFMSRTGGVIQGNTIFSLFLPVSAVTMIIATLFNMFIAIIVGLYLIFFCFVISGGSMPVVIIAFSSAILGVFVLSDVEKRTDFLRGGLVIGIVNSVVTAGICLMADYSLSDTLTNIELALANGIINSILVLGVFPVFENLFGITTKFNLLELSDLNAPIFRRMLIKAPGTYNHSLMVANMAEAACKDIGANYLLARVGGYYHDIGKIPDAGIYIENKVTDGGAKSLSPEEYSRLIISHVEKGVDLAHKNRLPEQIIDFVREHHGKSTMTYFYHQALESSEAAGNGGGVNKSDFQYPGPRPRSRESAVVMLADSVEAASRSLQEPTYVKLESLVKRIIYNKLNEDELEHSDLTMQNLNKIQKAFMRILNGIFHTRIEYPEKEEIERLEQRVAGREDD